MVDRTGIETVGCDQIMTKGRMAMNVLWCFVALFALLSWPIIRRDRYEQQREKIADQRADEFVRYSPARWAVVGEACHAYWQVAKEIKDEFAPHPPLPALLNELIPRYMEIGSEGFTVYWSDGFYGDDSVSLDYQVTEDTEKLFFSCTGQSPFSREVWSESSTSQR